MRCTGMIDYDDGFNILLCRKCGTRYFASDLEDKNPSNDIINTRGGKYPMKVSVIKDGKVYETTKSSTNIIAPKKKKPVNRTLKVSVVYGNSEAPKATVADIVNNVYKSNKIEEKPVDEVPVIENNIKEEVKEVIPVDDSEEKVGNVEDIKSSEDKEEVISNSNEKDIDDYPETVPEKEEIIAVKKITFDNNDSNIISEGHTDSIVISNESSSNETGTSIVMKEIFTSDNDASGEIKQKNSDMIYEDYGGKYPAKKKFKRSNKGSYRYIASPGASKEY